MEKTTDIVYSHDWETLKRAFEYWRLSGFTVLPSKSICQEALLMRTVSKKITKKGR